MQFVPLITAGSEDKGASYSPKARNILAGLLLKNQVKEEARVIRAVGPRGEHFQKPLYHGRPDP